jgi:hypothetical protein
LEDYSNASSWAIQAPVPVEDIVKWLGYELEYDDLQSRFGLIHTIGFIKFAERKIWIDEYDCKMGPYHLQSAMSWVTLYAARA